MKEIKFDLLENVPILKHNLIELHVILQLYSIYKISRKSRIIILCKYIIKQNLLIPKVDLGLV